MLLLKQFQLKSVSRSVLESFGDQLPFLKTVLKLHIIFVAAGFFLGEVSVKYVWSGWFYFSSDRRFFFFSLLFVACNRLNLMHYFPQSISFSLLSFDFFPLYLKRLNTSIKLSLISFLSAMYL